jgi:hypothetical protein
MGENRTGEYQPCFRAYRDMIICSVNVIGQKQILGGACNSFFLHAYPNQQVCIQIS